MTTLTAVIITRHKKNAEDTRKSVSFADEIIIVESGEIKNFSVIRNRALKAAKSDWVLFVDDDETVSPKLRKEVSKAIRSKNVNGYFLRRVDRFLGRVLLHGETGSIKLLRLARRSAGQFHRPVHEVWYIEGPTETLKNPLLHTPHKSISSFLSKINRYSTLEAEYRFKRGRRSSLFYISVYPLGKFLRSYILLRGFLDGTPGLIMAVMMSFHSFQTWTKLYLLQNQD